MTSPSQVDSPVPPNSPHSRTQVGPQPPPRFPLDVLAAATSDGFMQGQIQGNGNSSVGPAELPVALISATEQMLDVPDANSLWPVMAREGRG
jgi:hypothetical protein